MVMRFRTHIRVTHAVADEMSTIKCPCLCETQTVSVGLGTLKNKKAVSSLEYVVLGV